MNELFCITGDAGIAFQRKTSENRFNVKVFEKSVAVARDLLHSYSFAGVRSTLDAPLTLWLPGVAKAQTPSPVKLAVGAFGGLALPIVQDDQKSGTVFGFYGRIKFIPVLVFEPNVSFAKYGDPDPIGGVNLGIVGSKITSFGVDAVLGAGPGAPGVTPFFFGGIGSYSIKNDDTNFDESALGFSGGLGLGFNLGMLDLNVRGRAIVVPLEDGGSKKSATATVGLCYVLGK